MHITVDMMTEERAQQRPIVMPEIGAEGQPLLLVQWLVEPGAEVLSGDRLAEVVAAGVLFYVQAPFNGRIVSLDKPAGSRVNTGDVLGCVRIDES